MVNDKKLFHVINKCDYHIIWVPKCRYRILTGELGERIDHDFRLVSEWLGSKGAKLLVNSNQKINERFYCIYYQ